MGSIVTFSCCECGYRHDFWLGAGMLDYQPFGINQTAQQIRNGSYGEALKSVLEKHATARILRSTELFYCENCKECTTESYVRLFKAQRSEWKLGKLLAQSKHVCKSCNNELQRIEDAEDVSDGQVACPHCRAPMSYTKQGCWD